MKKKEKEKEKKSRKEVGKEEKKSRKQRPLSKPKSKMISETSAPGPRKTERRNSFPTQRKQHNTMDRDTSGRKWTS